jgi:hypothetical protein
MSLSKLTAPLNFGGYFVIVTLAHPLRLPM